MDTVEGRSSSGWSATILLLLGASFKFPRMAYLAGIFLLRYVSHGILRENAFSDTPIEEGFEVFTPEIECGRRDILSHVSKDSLSQVVGIVCVGVAGEESCDMFLIVFQRP